MDNEAELVSAAREGDESAAAQLFRKYESRIFNYLARTLGDRMEAEDATIEAFVKALNALDTYEEKGQFKSWLYRIAHREGLKKVRTRRTWTLHESSLLATDGAAPVAVDTAPLPIEKLSREERAEALENAMLLLPDVEKQVVLLRTQSGLSFKEIAEVMECPINTALGRMRNATNRLRRILTEQGT